MSRFGTMEDLIDNLPSDNQFVFHNKEMIEKVMDAVPLDPDWEKYRLALFLKTGDYKHPLERAMAVDYMETLEKKHRSRYYGMLGYNLAGIENPTDADCPDEHVMVAGKCYPVDQVEEGISGEVYEEVGYYNEADLVPPITSSTYRVPKESKQRKYSSDTGPR